MRRLALLAVASVTSLALATPALTVAANAADGSSDRVSQSVVAKKKKQQKIVKLKRAEKGVQPGIAAQKITATVKGSGKVKFTVKGDGGTVKGKVKVKKGKAVYNVPPLGTGKYKVTAKFGKSKKKTKFEVYDSALTINQSLFTVSKSNPYATNVPLTGNVKFKGKAATGGYVDVYKDGNVKGGSGSPDFLGFGTITDGGNFTYASFTTRVAQKYEPGTYNFQAFYTDGPEFSDYISSNFIVVTVTP